MLPGRSHAIIGESPVIRDVMATARRAAQSSAPLLIYGETGTGKELLARAVHDMGPRQKSPLFAVNCSALTESLLEEELFGHVKGAFTGATQDRPGVFETADGGTMLLDEISDMSARCQGMLLRTLQEGEVRPVGSSRTRKVDVRVIAASNTRLEDCCERGAFRRDLFYRLNVVSIRLPPLRERPEDIPLLARHFLTKFRVREGKLDEGIQDSTMERICAYHWPGNIRELENTIRRAVVLSDSGRKLSTSDFPVLDLDDESQASPPATGASRRGVAGLGAFSEAKAQAVADFERGYLMALLEKHETISAAARAAGMDRSNLKRLLRRHKVTP